jgi:hypothetical protein
MNLPGRLRLTTLGDVLGAVYREGATGVLELTESLGPNAGRVHRVHFADGLVRDVDSKVTATRLGDVLKQRGLVDDASLRRLAVRVVSAPGRKVGEHLVEMGAVSAREIGSALRLQRRERLERLFQLDDARLAFRVARGSEAEPAVPLEPREYLHGRARSRDRETGGGGHRRDPVRTRALATLGLAGDADRATVQRAFRQLAAQLHPDRFPAAGAADRAQLMRRFAEITAAYHLLVA